MRGRSSAHLWKTQSDNLKGNWRAKKVEVFKIEVSELIQWCQYVGTEIATSEQKREMSVQIETLQVMFSYILYCCYALCFSLVGICTFWPSRD